VFNNRSTIRPGRRTPTIGAVNGDKVLREFDPPLAVEQLVFEVATDAFDAWRAADHEYWTLAEAERFPFLRTKEMWVSRQGPICRVTIVITWDSLEAWQSIDPAWVEDQERRFSEAVGAGNYRLVAAPHETEQFFKISEYR
jgi:uncharacterized protein (TIGR03792 family)